MIISEKRVAHAFTTWMESCDGDEFARMAGELFGGECSAILQKNDDGKVEVVYDFEPNDAYYGEFEELDNIK